MHAFLCRAGYCVAVCTFGTKGKMSKLNWLITWKKKLFKNARIQRVSAINSSSIQLEILGARANTILDYVIFQVLLTCTFVRTSIIKSMKIRNRINYDYSQDFRETFPLSRFILLLYPLKSGKKSLHEFLKISTILTTNFFFYRRWHIIIWFWSWKNTVSWSLK